MSITPIGRNESRQEVRSDRTPPHDLLAEQSALGGLMLSKDALSDVFSQVHGSDFYFPKHELIYNAAINLFAAGEPVDVISVSDELTKRGELARAGGADYLHTLIGLVPTAANAGYYAGIVSEKAVLRRLVEVGTRIAQSGYEAEGEAEELLNRAQTEVFGISAGSASEDVVHVEQAITEATDDIQKAAAHDGTFTGIPTGFAQLDQNTNGFHPGNLILIAARPGVGKSTLALDIARNSAIKNKIPTVFFSLEMGRSEIAMRMISAESSIPLQVLRRGIRDSKDWTTLAHVNTRISDSTLYLDDSPNMTLAEIRAKCRRLSATTGLGLVIIDYLQLMSSGKKVENRQQEVSEFSRSLKLLAKELKIPVIALSQLNRGLENRGGNKEPQLSDLRESGSLEQDADIVLMINREMGVQDREDPRYGLAEILIAKNRNGPTGKFDVAFQGHLQRFSEIAPSA